jgi:hypothetical protein
MKTEGKIGVFIKQSRNSYNSRYGLPSVCLFYSNFNNLKVNLINYYRKSIESLEIYMQI